MPNTKQLPRWRTAGGAIVQLIEHTNRGENGYAWECGGCDSKGSHNRWFDDDGPAAYKFAAERGAVKHAESCKALPL